MWSFVEKKSQQRWLWLAIDHRPGVVLAYVLGTHQDEVFLQLLTRAYKTTRREVMCSPPGMNRPPTTGKEARRRQAWHLTPHGWSPRQSTEALGVSQGAVRQGLTRARQGGPAALRHRPPPGAPRRLPAAPLDRRPALWPRGTEADGVRGPVGTWGRSAAVMRWACGLTSPPRPGSRLLQALRWRLPKPARRARPRDAAAMARGRLATGPALNRGRQLPSPAAAAAMRREATPGPAWSAPTRRGATRRCSRRGGPARLARPSTPSRPRGSGLFTARQGRSPRPRSWPIWSFSDAPDQAACSSSGRGPRCIAAACAPRASRMGPGHGSRSRASQPRRRT
jgi:transposase